MAMYALSACAGLAKPDHFFPYFIYIYWGWDKRKSDLHGNVTL